MQIQSNEIKEFRRCSAYCTATSYQMKQLYEHLQKQKPSVTYLRSSRVLHYLEGDSAGDVFCFSTGTVVMWGLSLQEEKVVLQSLHDFEKDPVLEIEIEESRYSIGERTFISQDDIILPSEEMIIKLAFSHGLAQSVKLETFEKRIDKQIENMRYIPENLASRGRIPLSRKQLTKMMGELILEHNLINLYSGVMDTPDFFWEHSELEPIYRMVSLDLEVATRVNILNKRVDTMKDTVQVLSQEVSTRYLFAQEWVIIAWICFEVCMTFLVDVLKIL